MDPSFILGSDPKSKSTSAPVFMRRASETCLLMTTTSLLKMLGAMSLLLPLAMLAALEASRCCWKSPNTPIHIGAILVPQRKIRNIMANIAFKQYFDETLDSIPSCLYPLMFVLQKISHHFYPAGDEDEDLTKSDDDDGLNEQVQLRKKLGIPEFDPDALPSSMISKYLKLVNA